MSTMLPTVLEVELPPFFSKDEARLMMAVKLFETGRLTLGQASKTAGMSRGGFIDELGKLGIPVVDYPVEDLAEEVKW
jgi:predicted HTH domain antitoxin